MQYDKNTSFLSKNDQTRQYTLLIRFWLDERLYGVYNEVLECTNNNEADPKLKKLWKKCIENIKNKPVKDYEVEHNAIQNALMNENEDLCKLFKETIVAYLKTVYPYNVHVRFPKHPEFLKNLMDSMVSNVYVQKMVYFEKMGYSEKEKFVQDILTREISKRTRNCVVPDKPRRQSSSSRHTTVEPNDSISRLISSKYRRGDRDRRDRDSRYGGNKEVEHTFSSVAASVISRSSKAQKSDSASTLPPPPSLVAGNSTSSSRAPVPNTSKTEDDTPPSIYDQKPVTSKYESSSSSRISKRKESSSRRRDEASLAARSTVSRQINDSKSRLSTTEGKDLRSTTNRRTASGGRSTLHDTSDRQQRDPSNRSTLSRRDREKAQDADDYDDDDDSIMN